MKTKNKILWAGISAYSLVVGVYLYQGQKLKEEITFSSKIFEKFDMNKDGKISIKEFIDKYPKFNYKNSVPFSDYDFNKDNFIDSNEWSKAFPKDERAYFYFN